LPFSSGFFTFSSRVARCILRDIFTRAARLFARLEGKQKTTDILPSKHRTPTRAGAELRPSRRSETRKDLPQESALHDKAMRRLPHNALPTRGKIADGACKRHDAGQKTQEKEKNGQKNGNEPSHDETFPHRTYIEMKKLSRNLVVNVTTSTTMVGAVSLTPRKYGQKSNRPNIYPIFFIQIVNDFATF